MLVRVKTPFQIVTTCRGSSRGFAAEDALTTISCSPVQRIKIDGYYLWLAVNENNCRVENCCKRIVGRSL